MVNVYIKKVSDFNDIEIDLSHINIKRKAYLEKLSLNVQKKSYYSWILLKNMVKEEYGVDIDKLDLKYNEYGKPYFDEFCFNISHSKDYIAVAISNENVGVDIQYINDNNLNKLSKKINANSNDKYEVFKRFSALEAYLKYVGTGLLPSKLKEEVEITYQQIIKNENDEYILSIYSKNCKIKVH